MSLDKLESGYKLIDHAIYGGSNEYIGNEGISTTYHNLLIISKTRLTYDAGFDINKAVFRDMMYTQLDSNVVRLHFMYGIYSIKLLFTVDCLP